MTFVTLSWFILEHTVLTIETGCNEGLVYLINLLQLFFEKIKLKT